MKENFSSIDRIYGKDTPEEGKKEILRYYETAFKEQVRNEAFQKITGQEREKTKEEIELITFCNEKINWLREKYGLESFVISENNFHVIPEHVWRESVMHKETNPESTAFFSNGFQSVAMREVNNNLEFAESAYHELIHFHSYQAMMVEEKGKRIKGYRFGLRLLRETEEGKQLYFDNINEGLTEELAKRFIEGEYASENPHPLLLKGVQTMKGLRKEAKEKVPGSDLEKDLMDPELYHAEKRGDMGGEDFILDKMFFSPTESSG